MRIVHVIRKPTTESTLSENVLRFEVGGLHVEETRVAWKNVADKRKGFPSSLPKAHPGFEGKSFAIADRSHRNPEEEQSDVGRWPSNVILSHDRVCAIVGTRKVRTGVAVQRHGGGQALFGNIAGNKNILGERPDTSYADADGMEEIPEWACAQDCPVDALDRDTHHLLPQSGQTRNDVGGVSRFFKQVQ